MSNVDILISNPKFAKQDHHKIQHTQDKHSGEGNSQIDVMALAYYELIQTATTLSETALIQSKGLQGNAKLQKELNDKAGGMQWYYEPKLDSTRHVSYIGTRKHWWQWWSTVRKVTHTTHKNQATVANAQAKNQEVSAERQTLTQRMQVLQNTASRGETQVNTISDESTQAMQQGSLFMQIVQSLTFKALLRRQPHS